ncbi:MAG: tyrosine-type recombinase/integrase [Methylosarcina sp.]
MGTEKKKLTKKIIDAAVYEGNDQKGERCVLWDAELSGFGVRIYPTGKKSFILNYRHNGRMRLITIGQYGAITLDQARIEAKKYHVGIIQGTDPLEERQRARAGDTVKDLCAAYIDRHAVNKKSGTEYKRRIDQHIIPAWGKLKASAIRRADVTALHSKIGKNNGHYEANRVLALVSSMFSKAEIWGILEEGAPNPARGVEKFPEVKRDRFLQSDELPRFFSALAEEPNDIIRDYILMSLLTGARRANVLAMRWDQVNFERAEWRIPETKNGTPQTVTLSPEAIQILHNRNSTKSPFVFSGEGKTGHLVEPKNCWKRILDRAGLTDLRIHDLRRTLGSWQAKTGASLSIIGKSLNHKNTSTTAIYARLDLDPVRESVERATGAMLAAGGLKESGEIIPITKMKKAL